MIAESTYFYMHVNNMYMYVHVGALACRAVLFEHAHIHGSETKNCDIN